MKPSLSQISLILVISSLSAGCGYLLNPPAENLTVQIWKPADSLSTSSKLSAPQATRQNYEDIHPELTLQTVNSRKNVGIAVSGGGTRSAAYFAGQLMALEKMGVMDDIRYLSAVSGGAWAATPYTFYGAGDKAVVSRKKFVGDYIPPEKLTVEMLKMTDKKRGYSTLAGLNADAGVSLRAIKYSSKGGERYANALADIYLKKIGIGEMNKFFTHDEKTLQQALEKNDKLSRSDFYVAQKTYKEPFLICNSYLSNIRKQDRDRTFHAEMSPYYVGIKRRSPSCLVLENQVGGSLIETYGFDSVYDVCESNKYVFGSTNLRGAILPRSRFFDSKARFSLARIMASTGNAVATKVKFSCLSNVLGFPEYMHWSAQAPTEKHKKTTEYRFTDGGNLDNLGIMSLLARKVDTAIVFVNFEGADGPLVENGKVSFSDEIKSYFGLAKSKEKHGIYGAYEENIVLNNSKDVGGKTPYERLTHKLKVKIDKRLPLVVSDIYTTETNEMHGVMAGHKVKIIWVFPGATKVIKKGNKRSMEPIGSLTETDWFSKLPKETQQYMFNRLQEGEHLHKFPYFCTFLINKPSIIDLSDLQVNLLSQHAAYSVWENRELIKKEVRGARE